MERTSLDPEEDSSGLARKASCSKARPKPWVLWCLQLLLGPPHEIELLSPPETHKEAFLSGIFGCVCVSVQQGGGPLHF